MRNNFNSPLYGKNEKYSWKYSLRNAECLIESVQPSFTLLALICIIFNIVFEIHGAQAIFEKINFDSLTSINEKILYDPFELLSIKYNLNMYASFNKKGFDLK